MEKIFNCILIDDDLIVTESLMKLKLWQECGFNLIACFNNAFEAVEYLKTADVDLIISDIAMPKFNGLEFAKYCYEQYPDIYFSLLSAYKDFDYAHEAIQYGVKSYLVKPLTPRKLRKFLGEIYEKLLTDDKEKKFNNVYLSERFNHVIPEIINNGVSSVSELNDIIKIFNLPTEILQQNCITYDINMENYVEYFNSKWNYGIQRLYLAISFIVLKSTSAYLNGILRCNNNIISCIMVSCDCSPVKYEKIFEEMILNIRELLKLEVVISSVKEYDSFYDFVRNCCNYPKKYDKSEIVSMANDYIMSNLDNPNLSLDMVINVVNVSKSYFCALYKKQTGNTFTDAVNKFRTNMAKDLLKHDDVAISKIHEYVGYNRKSYFFEMFKKYVGMTPMEYKIKHTDGAQ